MGRGRVANTQTERRRAREREHSVDRRTRQGALWRSQVRAGARSDQLQADAQNRALVFPPSSSSSPSPPPLSEKSQRLHLGNFTAGEKSSGRELSVRR